MRRKPNAWCKPLIVIDPETGQPTIFSRLPEEVWRIIEGAMIFKAIVLPDTPEKKLQEAYHSKVEGWLSRLSNQQREEVFTITEPSHVARLLEKMREAEDEIDQIPKKSGPIRLPVQTVLRQAEKAFKNFKIAWTSSPFFHVSPAWACSFLKETLGSEFYTPCEKLSQYEQVGETGCFPNIGLFSNYRSVQFFCLLVVYLRKAIVQRCEAAKIPSELTRVRQIREYGDRTSYLSKRSNSYVFNMTVWSAMHQGYEKEATIGIDLEEKYFKYQEAENKKLLERIEKQAEPKKASKKTKRKLRKAEKIKKMKEEESIAEAQRMNEPNPEKGEGELPIVASDAYKTGECQIPSKTSEAHQETKKKSQPVEMFVDYFVPPTKQKNQRKGSTSTNNSRNFQDDNSTPTTPTDQKRQPRPHNKPKFEPKKLNFETEANKYENEVQKAASTLINNLLLNKLGKLQHENKEIWELKNTSYHRLLSYFAERLPYFSVDIFGSLATGVSLPSSDIDLLLTPQPFVQYDQYFLSDLAAELSLFGWVSYSNAILSAKIPVIKVVIDPFVSVDNPVSRFKFSSHEEQMATPFLIKVDITLNVAGANNTGLVSTAYMQSAFTLRPRLMEAMLIIKHLLEKAGLNEGYKGGVSSYHIFLMTICYAEHTQFNFNNPIADFLRGFLHFYTSTFDPMYEVLRYEPGKCSLLSFQEYESLPNAESLALSGEVKMVDPINGKLVRASFSRFEEVLNLFRQLLSAFRGVGEEGRLAVQPLMGKPSRKRWEVTSMVEAHLAQSAPAAHLAQMLFLP